MPETPLSAVLITQNEEEKIRVALESLMPLADEIVVLDSGSSDGTETICREYAVSFHHQDWLGYRDQKQRATELATHDWVLSLDADEAVSRLLSAELSAWKKKTPRAAGYLVSRKTFFMGRWIEHTSWFPDWQLRVFDRRKGSWEGKRVHEGFKIEGPPGQFKGCLEHYTYRSVSEYLIQLESFSTLAAADAYDQGKRARWIHFLTLPPFVFFQNYFLKRGFQDGFPGLTVSCLSACSVYFRYLKLFELQRGQGEQ